MILKLIETFFRHKWLILLPLVLIPVVVAPVALYFAPSYYQTSAGIWVDRATYLPANSDGFNAYMTPAQNQINRLNDQLRTRAFLLDIASRTPYGPTATTPAGEERFRRAFFAGFSVVPTGERVMTISYRAAAPQLAVQVVNAVIETFQQKVAAERLSQAEIAINFYETRAQAAEAELAKGNDALRRYVAANPRLTTIDPERGAASTTASRLGLPASAIDPQIAEILRRVELQQNEVARLRGFLEQARLDTSAAIQGQEVGFQLVDAPQLPTRLIQERRKALLYPAAAIVVGLGLSTALLVLLIASDRAVRTETDLAEIGRVVGIVPRLRMPNGPQNGGLDATRRAIGFAAGALLPTPAGAK